MAANANGDGEGGRVLFVRIPERLHRELKDLARVEDRTVSGMVRQAIRQYLDRTLREGQWGTR